jgi:hypothetical protein
MVDIKTKGGGVAQKALDAVYKALGTARSVDVGFMRGATYPDGTSVALVAAINEYGRSKVGQPPRPFFRNMIAAKQKEWGPATAKLLVAHQYDAKAVLTAVGEAVEGQLKASIDEFVSPPLKPSTIAAKGFDKPLIDTGEMRKSVTYQVR